MLVLVYKINEGESKRARTVISDLTRYFIRLRNL